MRLVFWTKYAFFLSLVEVRQKVKNAKFAWNFTRINKMQDCLRHFNQIFDPKMVHLGISQFIKNYAETT